MKHVFFVSCRRDGGFEPFETDDIDAIIAAWMGHSLGMLHVNMKIIATESSPRYEVGDVIYEADFEVT